MVWSHDHKSTLFRTKPEEFIGVSVAFVVTLVIKVDLVEVYC